MTPSLIGGLDHRILRIQIGSENWKVDLGPDLLLSDAFVLGSDCLTVVNRDMKENKKYFKKLQAIVLYADHGSSRHGAYLSGPAQSLHSCHGGFWDAL